MNKAFLTVSNFLLMLASCTNQPNDFPDYNRKNVYFPIQYPVRTLVLGESRLENTIDQEHAFSIGVCIAGMYENKQDWTVDYAVDEELLNGIMAIDLEGNKVPIETLPEYYYTFEPEETVMIPTGSFTGKIRVNLSDAFFEDEYAYKLHYVIPLKIVSSSCDGILWGEAVEESPNIHRASDWSSVQPPKFFTLFGVKFINPWHGTFFHRGVQYKGGEVDKTFAYGELEKGLTADIRTAGKMKALYNRMGEFLDGSKYQSLLTFSKAVDGTGDIVVSAPEGSPYTISGTGKYYESTTDFAKKNGSWLLDPETGESIPHLTIVLDYSVGALNGANYQFADTLVYRDNGVIYETFSPSIQE